MENNVLKILELLNSYKVGRKNLEERLIISAGNELIKDISWIEMRNILARLQMNKCIKVTAWPYNTKVINSGVDPYNDKDKSKRHYRITLLKGFDDYRQQQVDINKKSRNQVCLWISYSNKTREVLLNDIIILSKPNFNSTNDLVFKYLFNNPNITITRNKLEQNATKGNITKRLYEIIKDLGFKKELAKIFFSVSKNEIIFRNPITKQDLVDLENPKFRIKI